MSVDHQLPETLFGHLFDTAADGMVVVDGDGRILLANAQVEPMLGYTPAELVGEPVELLVPEAQRAGHPRLREAFTRQARPRPMGSSLSLFGQRKNGELLPVEIMLSPLTLRGRTLVCAAIRDVTDRKRVELLERHYAAEVREANELLRSALESFHGAFAVFDASDRLALCNSSCLAIFGRVLEGSLVGCSYEQIVRANGAAGVIDPEVAERWLEYHGAPQGAFELSTTSGSRMRVVDRPTPGGGTVSTAVDVTEDVRREEELRHARAAAEEASNAKSEFLASMSHELRTPLNAILGFAQLLQRDRKNPLTARQLERLQHVVSGGEHLLRLIDDVLDLARIEASRLTLSVEPVAVDEVLEEVLATLSPVAGRARITLTVPSDGSADCMVEADRTRLSQILLNFGSNAIKYGRAGGRATFRVEQGDQAVRILVADDGIGIPPELHDQVFEPFRRAGQETGPIEGTGIGLTICRRLAHYMGGAVGFSSAPGEGSTFWLELPRALRPNAPQLEAAPVEPGVSSGDGRRHVVVYVEDNPSNIAFMEAFFSDYEQVELICAPSAEIGLDIIRTHGPDIVLMDLNLPGMSGFEATLHLREDPQTAHIPVVAVSAAAMPRDREQARDAGFVRYLTKPVDVDDLAETVERLLRESAGG